MDLSMNGYRAQREQTETWGHARDQDNIACPSCGSPLLNSRHIDVRTTPAWPHLKPTTSPVRLSLQCSRA